MHLSQLASAVSLSSVLLTMAGSTTALPALAAPSLHAPALVPQPAHLTVAPNAAPFTLGAGTRILVTKEPEAQEAAHFLSGWLRQDTGITVPIAPLRSAADRKRPNTIVVTTQGADAALGAEGYALAAARQSVTIRAPHGAGLFYGGETLRQLLTAPTPAHWVVPAVTIRDQPRFRERSLMLDSARHYQSIAFLKRTLDLLAYHKMNTFHWHLTDDQGWRLEIKRYPRLTSVGAFRSEPQGTYGMFYSQAQVRDLVAYAAARHITIVPEIDMPAHCISLLAAYPENACFPRAFVVPTYNVAAGPTTPWTPDVLCAGREQTYTFMENILTEVMDLFPSRAIHIGGDECPTDRWKACPVCQAKIKTEGLKNERALQNYFTHRIAVFLSQHGRRLQGWNEIMDGGDLPRDVIVQPWNRPAATAAAVKAGNDAVVASTRYGYLDYGYSTTPLRRVYEWEPVPVGLTDAEVQRIQGLEACLWTEGKKDDADADRFLWPRLLAVAEVGWSPAAPRSWDDFRTRLESVHYARLAKMGLGDPAATDSATIQAALLDRSDFNAGVKVGEWVPSQMSETPVTLEWNVKPYLTTPGRYTVRLDYEAGADGIATYQADLLCNDAVIATDKHDGFAGGNSHDQTYRFDLPAIDPSARYTVRVRLRSDGGTDSRGSLYLAPPRAAAATAVRR